MCFRGRRVGCLGGRRKKSWLSGQGVSRNLPLAIFVNVKNMKNKLKFNNPKPPICDIPKWPMRRRNPSPKWKRWSFLKLIVHHIMVRTNTYPVHGLLHYKLWNVCCCHNGHRSEGCSPPGIAVNPSLLVHSWKILSNILGFSKVCSLVRTVQLLSSPTHIPRKIYLVCLLLSKCCKMCAYNDFAVYLW